MKLSCRFGRRAAHHAPLRLLACLYCPRTCDLGTTNHTNEQSTTSTHNHLVFITLPPKTTEQKERKQKKKMAPKKTANSSPPNWATSTFNTMWSHYQKTTTHQTKLIDIFLLFLVVVGAIQFVYYLVLARDVRTPPPQKAETCRFLSRPKGTDKRDNSHSMPSSPASSPTWANSFLLVKTPPVRHRVFYLLTGLIQPMAVSLRMQTDPQNKAEFPQVTPERYAMITTIEAPFLTCRLLTPCVRGQTDHSRISSLAAWFYISSA